MRPEQVREIALSLPEAEEKETWGEATFRVRDKIFTVLGETGKSAGVKASKEDQALLISSDPDTFSVSEYVGRFGWVTVQLARVDPKVMEELIVDAWRRTAPKRTVKEYDAGGTGGAAPAKAAKPAASKSTAPKSPSKRKTTASGTAATKSTTSSKGAKTATTEKAARSAKASKSATTSKSGKPPRR
ncbi:MAG TPA: MmcQ/YjbR family DNA-binding protein [Longimicrobium sp.]|nr:MmcQ/YjbR family DNA-binding protein [Longimicrobium sp.]